MSISPDVNPGTVDLNLDVPSLSRRWSIEKLSSFPQTLARHSESMKNISFGLVGVAMLAIVFGAPLKAALSKQRPVIADASQIDLSKINPALIGGDYFPKNQVNIDNSPSVFRDTDEIGRYIVNYLNDEEKSEFSFKRDRNLSLVMDSRLVTMKVTDPMGIIVRDFPDIRPERSRKMPTKGSATDSFFKALYFGQDIPGLFSNFVYEKDPETHQLLNIWAARLSNEGGWSIHKQPHSEFFRVGGLEQRDGEIGWKWYVAFDTEDGPISGEGYFGALFPKPKVASISPMHLSYSRYQIEFRGLEPYRARILSAAA